MAAVATIAVGLAHPSAALAGTASVGGNVSYVAAAGEQNSVTVHIASPLLVTITDSTATVIAGSGCILTGVHSANCATPMLTPIALALGDEDDVASVDGSSATFLGGAGTDTLTGGPGDDSLDGGEGADALAGGGGTDLADYASRTAPVNVSLLAGTGGEFGEGDTLSGIENVRGGSNQDLIVGDNGPNILESGPGGGILDGQGGDDALVGGSGGDSLSGSGGSDTLTGGAGDDQLVGGDDNDVLSAGPGFDGLSGGAGNDLLDGGLGSDSLDGGLGTDTADYSTRTNPVTVNLGDGIYNDGEADERDKVGGNFDDVENILGGSDDDYLVGNAAANTLDGGGGDDVLDGELGADVLIGGAGIGDAVDYSRRSANVTVTLDGIANDGETGENDNAGAGVEDIFGGDGDDTLTGDSGDNSIDGGFGADAIYGGAGIDTADYADRFDPLEVSLDGVANDGESGEGDSVGTDFEDFAGGFGDDTLVGSPQANVLAGGDGDDVLDGGLGADTLIGGDGIDDTADYSPRANAVATRSTWTSRMQPAVPGRTRSSVTTTTTSWTAVPAPTRSAAAPASTPSSTSAAPRR